MLKCEVSSNWQIRDKGKHRVGASEQTRVFSLFIRLIGLTLMSADLNINARSVWVRGMMLLLTKQHLNEAGLFKAAIVRCTSVTLFSMLFIH